MKRLAVLFLVMFIAVTIVPLTALAQTHTDSTEVTSDVPELNAIHTPIYKLWHTAWPKKDVATLVEILPQLQAGVAKIEKAQLPGILRDRKPKWEAGVARLKETLGSYEKAAASRDSAAILDAAEKIHMQYENLVRVVKPMVKEMDAFHQVLYMYHHYYIPDFRLDKIKENVAELKARMEKLNTATLPKRLEKRQADFDAKRADLDKAVKEFAAVVDKGKKKDITTAESVMHTKYEALEKVFD